MRSLTLLALLIASNFAIPFDNPKSALSRRGFIKGGNFIKTRSSAARANNANESGKSSHENPVSPSSSRTKKDIVKDVVDFFKSRNIDNVIITENSVLVGLLIKDRVISQEDQTLLGDYDLLYELFTRYGSLSEFISKDFAGSSDTEHDKPKESEGDSNKEHGNPKESDGGSEKEHDIHKESSGGSDKEHGKPKESDGSSDIKNDKLRESGGGSDKEHDKPKESSGGSEKEHDKPEETAGSGNGNLEPSSDHRTKRDVIEDVVEFFYNKEIDNLAITENSVLVGMLIKDGVINHEDLNLLGDYNLLYELFIRYGSLNEFIGKEFAGDSDKEHDKPKEDHTEEKAVEEENWQGWGDTYD